MSDLERMKELVEQLDAAARAYYQESKELMSNKEYDELYDELAALEKKTGTVLAKSPTAHAGYECCLLIRRRKCHSFRNF